MNVKEMVDQLGKVRKQKAKLEKAEKELAESLKKLGTGSYNGVSYAALVYGASKSALDLEGLCKEFEISDEDLKVHTKDKPYICVKVTPMAAPARVRSAA